MILKHIKPDPLKVPGFWDIKETPIISIGNQKNIFENKSIMMIENLLSNESCDSLIDIFLNCGIEAPVSVNGLKDDKVYGKGSKRATGWSETIANQLSELIIPHLDILYCDNKTATDWWQDEQRCYTWKPIAVSPMLRFMKYEKDSEHYAHYDAGYFYPDNEHRTLKSVVIYLTTNNTCATRFINDGQKELDVWHRNHEDWNRPVNKDELILLSHSKKGKVLIFDHRLCHDVEKYDGAEGNRIIIRTDIIYKKI